MNPGLSRGIVEAHISELNRSAHKSPVVSSGAPPHPIRHLRRWAGKQLLRWGAALVAMRPETASVGAHGAS